MKDRTFILSLLISGLIMLGIAVLTDEVSAAISYNPATGALSSTTSLNNSFIEQLYVADKAGALALRTVTITANTSTPVAHTYKFEPADYLMLGGTNNDFYVTLAGWDATLLNLTVRIYGTNWYGVNQSEDLYFTGNSVVYTTLLYRTSNSSMVFKCWKTGAFSVSVVVSQGQWGRVWRTGTNSYRFVNCTPALSGFYNQTNTSISFYPASTVCINFGTAGKAIFGNLSSTGVARWGCTFINEKNVNASIAATAAVTYMKFYACSFMSYRFNRSSSSLRLSETLGMVDVRNCVFSQNSYVISGGTNSILKRNTFVSSVGGIANVLGTTALVDDQFFDNVSIPISMGTSATYTYNCTVNNYDYLFKWTPIGLTPIKHHLRNFKVLGNMKCQYLGTATGLVEVRFQYGISLRVRNGTANLSGATVQYFEINASSLVRKRVQSLTTGADGLVTYKFLNRSIWLKGNVYPRSNYTVSVWINKSGYQSVRMNFTMSRELVFDVVLLKNYSSGLVINDMSSGVTGSLTYYWSPFTGVHGEWWVNDTHTGIISGGGSTPFIMDNPNPANGTCLGYNFIQANPLGLKTCIDINYTNFTTLDVDTLGDSVAQEYFDSDSGLFSYLDSSIYHGQSFTIGGNGQNVSSVLHNFTLNMKWDAPFTIYASLHYQEDMAGFYDSGGIYQFNVTNTTDSNLLSIGSRVVDWVVGGEGYELINITMEPVVLYPRNRYIMVFYVNESIISFPRANVDFVDLKYPFGFSFISGDGIEWGTTGLIANYWFNVSGWTLGYELPWDNVVNLTFLDNTSGSWVPYDNIIYSVDDTVYAVNNGSYCFLNTNMIDNYTQYFWRVIAVVNGTVMDNKTFTFNTSGTFGGNLSDDWLFIAGFDINPEFLLLSIFFGLLYFWWKSEDIAMMLILTMIIVPYDYVVMTIYLLPIYITNATILLFMQGLFVILSIVIMGYTIELWDKSKKAKKGSNE